MANYGHIQATGKQSYPFKGKLVTPTFGGEIAFKHVTRSSDKAPNFEVVMDTPHGVCEIGAAWEKTTEKGATFFSIQIDHPGMPEPMWLSAFKNEKDATTFDVVWSRQRGAAKTAGNTQKTGAFEENA